MGLKSVGGVLFALLTLLVISSFLIYWFYPVNLEFSKSGYSSGNFSINGLVDINGSEMQFYPNMRYPSDIITYKIDNCPLKKKNDMELAFNILSAKTVLTFIPSLNDEEISVSCDSEVKMDGELFIAGEGGPVNITKTSLFNVISNGQILLIKDSNCYEPNIALHELLHTLGFKHSDNKKNIMYPVSDCSQIISEDMISLINKLYEIPKNPDLVFENASGNINKKYLNTEILIRNNGLESSGDAQLFIYVDDSLVKTLDVKPLEIGSGIEITLKNVLVLKINPQELKFIIQYNKEEISKTNNELILGLAE